MLFYFFFFWLLINFCFNYFWAIVVAILWLLSRLGYCFLAIFACDLCWSWVVAVAQVELRWKVLSFLFLACDCDVSNWACEWECEEFQFFFLDWSVRIIMKKPRRSLIAILKSYVHLKWFLIFDPYGRHMRYSSFLASAKKACKLY